MSRLITRLAVIVLSLSMGDLLTASEPLAALPADVPQVDWAWPDLAQALTANGAPPRRVPLADHDGATLIVLADATQASNLGLPAQVSEGLGAESFRITRLPKGDRQTLVIAGGGPSGAMYGMLDTAEQLRLGGSLDTIVERSVSPSLEFRAIKFNLPWMSYRKAEALSLHEETCRDLAFWEAFLDMMARNRFNTLTLWNLHPFAYLIRPTNFPDASPFDQAELADWQHFWRTLFRMAKDRGISTYLINWNIFVSPALAESRGLAPYSKDWSFFGAADTSEMVERYNRECVTQVIDEYEDLTGLGITLGERMGGMTASERRDWLDRTFVAGMKAAKRPARFIHRAPLSAGTGSGGSTSVDTEQLTRQAIESMDLQQPVWVEFKYNWSHGHSTPTLEIVHGGPITDTYWNPRPEAYKVLWTVRNEDFFILRWGEPDFIRAFLANNTQDYVGGVLVGSECYIPARDYMTRPEVARDWTYGFERQWLFYRVWGRLLYDPTTPDAVFAADLAARHGLTSEGGNDLLEAWRRASRVPLRFASFYRGEWDGSLYSEAYAAGVKADQVTHVAIDQLINHPTLDPRMVSIADFVRDGRQKATGRISPLELADQLQQDATEAEARIARIESHAADNPGLACELADIAAWNALGRYFAASLRGGVALETYRRGGEPAEKQAAIDFLEQAAAHWDTLCESVTRFNREEIPAVFDSNFSWSQYKPDVLRDIETARQATPRRD